MTHRKFRSRVGPAVLGAFAGSALLGGCAAVPRLGPAPAVKDAGSYAADQTLAPAAGSATPGDAWPGAQWWTAYADPQLTALVVEGLAGAPDLAAAEARLRAARALADQAGAARLPSIGVQGNISGTKQSYNNGIPVAFVPKGWNDTGSLAGRVDFDLDLWGKNRAALAAATSQTKAARIDLEQARLMLSTGIASAYADLARLAAERVVQERALAVRQETLALVANRVATGLDTEAERKQAEAAVPAARADLAATDEAIALTRNSIAALIGKGPDRGLSIALPALLPATQGLPAGATTDLIGRRPDIASARARLEAEASRIKVARAEFYPSVSLSALAGYQSLGLSNLFKSGSTYGQAGPAISLPIFRGGQLSGQYRQARANYDAAVATYDGTVAAAFREVADAVASRNALATRLGESRAALAAAEQAHAIARLRYQGGLSTFLNVLSAEEAVLQNRRAVADLETRAFTLDVALVRALGGGFSTLPASAALKDTPHG